jgi:polysaccharide chain length determinant protein (PEP-CTERM system associated)
VLTAATVLAILTPVAIGLPNLYRSNASLMVDQGPEPIGQGNTQMLELSGRLQAIRQEALRRQRVLELAEELDLYPEQRQAGMFDAVVSMMQRDLKVEPVSATRSDGRQATVSFRISYTGSDPQKVATVTNRLAQFYVERNGAMQVQNATRAAEALRQELDTTRQRLDAQEKRVIAFTAQNAGTLPAQMTSITSKYSQLLSQLQANTGEIGRLTERRDNAQNQIATLSSPSAAADVADPAIRLAAAQRELQALLAKYTDVNIDVRNKRSEIAGLQAQVAARNASPNGTTTGTSVLATLQTHIGEWTERIAALQTANEALQKDLDKYDAIIERAPVRNAEFESISREAGQTRSQYDSLYTRYQEALVGERAQQGRGRAEFQVLDPAMPAEAPSAPDRRLLLALAIVLALGLGSAVVLLLDRMDRSFRSVDELRAFTHVPVLATIPKIVSRKAQARRLVIATAAAVAVSIALVVVSVGVFRVAQQAEPITRMLLR